MKNRAKIDIFIYRGDTAEFSYQVIDVNDDTGEEVIADISSFNITGQARYSSDSDEVWHNFDIVKKDPKNGIFSWSLTKQQSEELLPVGGFEPSSGVYDIQMEVNEKVYTFVYGSFAVSRDVTRA